MGCFMLFCDLCEKAIRSQIAEIKLAQIKRDQSIL